MSNKIRGFYLLDKNNEITKSLELFADGTYKLKKESFVDNEEKIKYIDEVLEKKESYPKLVLNSNGTYDILLESGKAEIEDKEILKEILDEYFANPNENIETWAVIDSHFQ